MNQQTKSWLDVIAFTPNMLGAVLLRQSRNRINIYLRTRRTTISRMSTSINTTDNDDQKVDDKAKKDEDIKKTPNISADASKDGDRPVYVANGKKVFALLFGYSGIGFYGLQIQKDVPTIEGHLEAAICKTGVIKDGNMGDLKKSGWTRAARTDKGVHAFGQVISLKMNLCEYNIDKFLTALNAELPPKIQVFDCVQTNKRFNAKNQCSGRKYEYLIPTFMFASPLVIAGEDFPEDSDADAQLAFLKEYKERICKDFKFDESVKARLDRCLAKYVGTESYHNFTIRVAPDDGAAKRFIVSCDTDGPFIVNGTEFIRINLEGQSFMLHQIRMMVGAAVELTRRKELDIDETMAKLLSTERYDVPMAPGEGLALRACLYKFYNNKFAENTQQFGLKHAKEPIDFLNGLLATKSTKFRDEIVYPEIAAQEQENYVFVKHLYKHSQVPFPPAPKPSGFSVVHYTTKKEEREQYAKKRFQETRREQPSKRQKEVDEFCNETVSHIIEDPNVSCASK